jgi:flagellum-specific peptidoglycan hydrolase FlgJ
MTPKEFIKTFKPYAVKLQKESGIDYRFTLAQGALESGWGKSAVGNNFFGVKDTDGVNGNEQLITTTEFLYNANAKFPSIISKVLVNPAKKLWKYVVKDYFRKYDTAYESFKNHSDFFFKNSRYKTALIHRADPYRFAEEVAKAGYATDPNYAKVLKSVIKTIENHE